MNEDARDTNNTGTAIAIATMAGVGAGVTGVGIWGSKKLIGGAVHLAQDNFDKIKGVGSKFRKKKSASETAKSTAKSTAEDVAENTNQGFVKDVNKYMNKGNEMDQMLDDMEEAYISFTKDNAPKTPMEKVVDNMEDAYADYARHEHNMQALKKMPKVVANKEAINAAKNMKEVDNLYESIHAAQVGEAAPKVGKSINLVKNIKKLKGKKFRL